MIQAVEADAAPPDFMDEECGTDRVADAEAWSTRDFREVNTVEKAAVAMIN